MKSQRSRLQPFCSWLFIIFISYVNKIRLLNSNETTNWKEVYINTCKLIGLIYYLKLSLRFSHYHPYRMLTGKKILFIGVKFYHYHEEIVNKLEDKFGAKVIFHPERDTSIVYGLVNRIVPSRIEQYQDFYYRKLFEKLEKKKFDYFLVIRGFKMPLWFVRKIKKTNPNIKTIYYQWDSNTNSPFIGLQKKYNVIEEFDDKFSFDYKDVRDFPILKYCPTFFTDEIEALRTVGENSIKYDLFYFGSYLPERYQGLLKFIEYSNRHGYTLKAYFYMPLRYYIIERIKGAKIDRNLIETKPMNRTTYLNLLRESRCIVDVSNAKQTGLAMRVIDSFGACKKVLTTNKWISKDKSYNPTQALVIDIENIDIPDGFLKAHIRNEIEYDFSLEQWIKQIFSIR